MPINILGFTIKKSVKSKDLLTYTITVIVAAGATRIVSLPNEFGVMGVGAVIQNLDGANSAIVIVNNDRIGSKTLTSAHPLALNELNIVQLEVTAGAAGATEIVFEVVNFEDIT